MNIFLGDLSLHISESKAIYGDMSLCHDWKWLLDMIPPEPISNTKDYLITRDMYTLYYDSVTLGDIVAQFLSIESILNNEELVVAPEHLGGAAITAVYLGIDDFPIQRLMYKRRHLYTCMHPDIGIPSYSMKDSHIRNFKGDMSPYTVSDFNGTFLPYGYKHRKKVVHVGDLDLSKRIVYNYLCSLNSYRNWIWGLGTISSEMKRYHNYCNGEVSIGTLKLCDLKEMLPSLNVLSPEDQIELCKWYIISSEVVELHKTYPESRNLFLKYTLSDHVLSALCELPEYMIEIITYKPTLAQYIRYETLTKILDIVTDKEVRLLIILYGSMRLVYDTYAHNITPEAIVLIGEHIMNIRVDMARFIASRILEAADKNPVLYEYVPEIVYEYAQ